MSSSTQSVVFNAVPLLVLALVHLGASVALAPPLWRERRRLSLVDVAVALEFPCVGLAAAILAGVVLYERTPLGGHLWAAFAACVLALVPGLLLLARRRERRLFAFGVADARRAEERTEALGRELESVAHVTNALARTRDRDEAARILLDEVAGLLGVEFAALALVDEDGRTARGLLARGVGDLAWWRDVAVDLESQPSGIASAYHDAGPVTVYDCAASPIVSPALAQRVGARSAAFVPLVLEERVIGVLVVASTGAPRAFSSEDARVLEAIAADAALAIDRARSADALRQALRENETRLDRQAALLEAAQALSSELRPEAVLEHLVEHVARLVGADAADCYLFEAERRVLRCAAVYGLAQDLVGFEFPADLGVAGAAIRTGGPTIASEYEALVEAVPHEAYEGFSAAVVAPMRWADETYGVLGVGARGGRTFGPVDAEVLDTLAGLASLALRNAEILDARERQTRVQTGFYRIASALGQSLSLPETLAAVAQAAADALGGSFAAVLMPGGEGLELAGAHALPEAARRGLEGERRLADADWLRAAAADRRLLVSEWIADDERFDDGWRELAARAGVQVLLAVPIEAPRRESGGVVLVLGEGPRGFTDDDLELARQLADAARGALERAELFEAERSARALAQELARTGSLLAAELDPSAVLDEVVQQAPALVRADACAIRLLEGEALVVSAVAGERTAETIGSSAAAASRLSGDVVQSRSPLALDDAAADPRLVEADAVLAAGYRAYLGVPLVGPEGTLHGSLSVYGRRRRSWRDEEVEALQALAGNTAAALSNAELYQRVALDKERSFAILGNVADGIVAVDRDGRVVLWNAAAERITGVPAAEAVGRTPLEVLRRSLESEDPQPGERLVSIPRGDEEVWLSVSEAVMRDPAGVVAGRIFAFRDISADRLVEQLKSSFVSTVSHELRTPLTSIYGFAETLLRDDVQFGEAERLTFLRYIARESERLTGIVDALLNVARLEAGDLQVNVAPTDVREVASEAIDAARASGSNGRSFVLDVPDEPLAAEADREKLRQVLAILLENAVKYSQAEGRITVEARRRRETVEVNVVDEGIGIPEAEQERIFRKFYRGEAVGNGATGGTGLGLFIARELVAAMGGSIRVRSAEGHGSSFTFELPLAEA